MNETLLDPAEIAEMDALADELRSRRNAAQCDCEQRNAYGYPVLPDTEGPYADWSEADRRGLASLQTHVMDALGDYHDCADIAWIVEETLWQLRATLLRGYKARVPLLGDLALRRDGTLIAAAVPGLCPEVRS